MPGHLTPRQVHTYDQNTALLEASVDIYVQSWTDCAAHSCCSVHAMVNYAAYLDEQIRDLPLQQVVMTMSCMARRLAGDR